MPIIKLTPLTTTEIHQNAEIAKTYTSFLTEEITTQFPETGTHALKEFTSAIEQFLIKKANQHKLLLDQLLGANKEDFVEKAKNFSIVRTFHKGLLDLVKKNTIPKDLLALEKIINNWFELQIPALREPEKQLKTTLPVEKKHILSADKILNDKSPTLFTAAKKESATPPHRSHILHLDPSKQHSIIKPNKPQNK